MRNRCLIRTANEHRGKREKKREKSNSIEKCFRAENDVELMKIILVCRSTSGSVSDRVESEGHRCRFHSIGIEWKMNGWTRCLVKKRKKKEKEKKTTLIVSRDFLLREEQLVCCHDKVMRCIEADLILKRRKFFGVDPSKIEERERKLKWNVSFFDLLRDETTDILHRVFFCLVNVEEKRGRKRWDLIVREYFGRLSMFNDQMKASQVDDMCMPFIKTFQGRMTK